MINDWRSMNSALFEALQVERVAMFIVLSPIIVLVAVFNILSSLIMLVRAKTRDIAVLRTMGATRAGLMKVFMTVGVTIGVLGIVAGMVLGAVFLFYRQPVVRFVPWVTGRTSGIPRCASSPSCPPNRSIEVTAIVVMTLVLTFLATLYPAWKAATDPVQVPL